MRSRSEKSAIVRTAGFRVNSICGIIAALATPRTAARCVRVRSASTRKAGVPAEAISIESDRSASFIGGPPEIWLQSMRVSGRPASRSRASTSARSFMSTIGIWLMPGWIAIRSTRASLAGV
jgi:hypothetical protein